jgi:hypothetical protein
MPSTSSSSTGLPVPRLGMDGQANAAGDPKPPAKSKTTVSVVRSTATSLLFFFVAFIALRHVQPSGIMFYQGVVVGVFVSLIQFLLERRRETGEAAKNALLTFLLIYSFVFTIPTTVDRAYSVKLLTALGRSPAGLTRDEINDHFVHWLVAEGGVDKRLVEQTSTGSIRANDGRYSLTLMGRLLDASFRLSRVVFASEDASAVSVGQHH